MSVTLLHGDCRAILPTLPEASVQCCVTSPPYWGLRDYGHADQIGLESSPTEYVEQLVAVFREVRRVLRDDGTLWLNLGDCYATGAGRVGECPGGGEQGARWKGEVRDSFRRDRAPVGPRTQPNRMPIEGLKAKDLIGLPWRVAFALQADGWWLRSDIVWAKANPMPESVTDRPTKAHEYVFLLAKSERYYFDAAAVREPDSGQDHRRTVLAGQPSLEPSGGILPPHGGLRTAGGRNGQGRNVRSVWTIATTPFHGAHFAVMPRDLARRCILAGSRIGDTVLDPFGGSGTVGEVATQEGRHALLIELNDRYCGLAEQRTAQLGLLAGAHRA